MELVLENVEIEIHKLFDEMAEHPMAWRSIHCLWPHVSRYQLETLRDILTPVLEGHDSFAFRWGSEDIFIISKGLRKETLDEARVLIEKFCRKQRMIAADEPCEVLSYDLSVAWEEFQQFFTFRKKEIQTQDTEGEETLLSIRGDSKEDQIRLILTKARENIHNLQRRASRPGVTILVVDPDEGSLSTIAKLCRGYKVVRSKNGKEALLKYFEEAPDLVIMDTKLPILNGWEVMKHIYENDENAFVIMVTASTDERDVQRAINFGVKGYVKKPFSAGKFEQYLDLFKKKAPIHKRVNAV